MQSQEITTIQQLAELITHNQTEINKKFEDLTDLVIENTDKIYEDLASEIKLVNIKLDNNTAEIKAELKSNIEKINFKSIDKRTDILEH